MDIPSLIENGVSPKLNFGSLVGLSSFWWSDEHLDTCLDGFVKNHRYGRITWYSRPY
jgi:hypothetical protein